VTRVLAALVALVPFAAEAQVIGTAFSGATSADGASAYLNPAAMAAAEGTRIELDAGVDLIDLDYEADATDPSSTTIPVPLATLGGFTDAAHDDLRLGLTVGVPYRNGGEWDRAGGAGQITRYYLVSAMVFNVTITPAVSWSPVEWLTIGAGVDVVHGVLDCELDKDLGSELNQRAGSPTTDGPFPYAHPDLAAPASLSASGWGVGVVGGVLVEPTDHLSIGAAIHSPVHVPASGTVDVTYPATLDEYVGAFLPSAQLPELSGEIEVDLDVPMLVTAGVLVRPEERWEIALDYSFEHRSSQPSLDFVVTQATSPSIADTQKVQGYRDRHGLNLRVAFSPIERLRLAVLAAFESSSVPDEVFTPNNMDFDKWIAGLAVHWRMTTGFSMSFEYQHYFLVPRDIETSLHRPLSQPSLAAFNHPSPTGRYSGMADRLQLGLNVHL
jgi:long-subunit fatty acid transport protein